MVFILYLLYLSIDFKGFINYQNIAFMVSLSHVTCLETSCNSCSLQVDRKYQQPQSRDNYIIVLFKSKYKRRWINMILYSINTILIQCLKYIIISAKLAKCPMNLIFLLVFKPNTHELYI